MLSGSSNMRWSHQANVERYRRLLRTPLTDIEKQYVRRRLAEERQACRDRLPPEIDQEINGLCPPQTGEPDRRESMTLSKGSARRDGTGDSSASGAVFASSRQ